MEDSTLRVPLDKLPISLDHLINTIETNKSLVSLIGINLFINELEVYYPRGSKKPWVCLQFTVYDTDRVPS